MLFRSVMNVYTVETEKEAAGSEKQEQQAQDDQKDQDTKEEQAANQETGNTETGFGKDNTAGSDTGQKQVTPMLQEKAKTPATTATTDLPQTGETKHQTSILGLLALGLASLFTLVNFDRKKETK